MVWVNLLPWRWVELQKRWRVWRLVVVGALLLLTVGICHGQWQRTLNQQYVTTLTLWSAALKGAVALGGQMLDARQQTTRLQLQLEKLRFHQQQMALWLNFARTLGQHFTPDAWLHTLRKTRFNLEFQGTVGSISALHQLRDRLNTDALFSDVTLGQVQRVNAGEMQFTLLASLVAAGETSDE